MLTKLPLRVKLTALPLLVSCAFLMLLVTNAVMAGRTSTALTDIGQGYVPALQLSIALEDRLDTFQRGAQDAVAAEDVTILEELREVRASFAPLLDQLEENHVVDRHWVTRIRAEMDAYTELALSTSRSLIGGRMGPELALPLKQMADQFTQISAELSDHSQRSRQGVEHALARSRAVHTQLNWAVLLLCAGAMISSLLLSSWIGRDVTSPLAHLAHSARTTAIEIVDSVHAQSETIQATATSVSEATTTVNELQQTSRLAADRSRQVMSVAQESLVTADRTVQSVRQGVRAMAAIRAEMSGTADHILELSRMHIEIGEIVESVNGIAEQSNLLAVNASIEAAKAGELGRGFAVVASEVRALADKSKEATRQIRTLLTDLQGRSNAAVMVAEQGIKRVHEGDELIEALGRTIEEFRTVLENSAGMARQISVTTEQQQIGLDQIVEAMAAIDQASRRNAVGAQQMEDAAAAMDEVSGQVSAIVHGKPRQDRAA